MKTLISFLFFGLFFLPTQAQQSEPATQAQVKPTTPNFSITLPTKDKFNLSASYYPGKKNADGVVILHDCKSDRTRYENIGQNLHEQGYHALVLDLRGYGKSVSTTVSHQDIKARAKDIVLYQQMLALITAYWEDDVLTAYHFLRERLSNKNSISIVASGCSVAQAVSTAEKMHVANMVIITPFMDYSAKERYKNLTDIPTYFIDSVHSISSYQTTKELFDWNGHSRSKQLLFKGNSTDGDLLKRNQSLVSDIVMWLSEQSR